MFCCQVKLRLTAHYLELANACVEVLHIVLRLLAQPVFGFIPPGLIAGPGAYSSLATLPMIPKLYVQLQVFHDITHDGVHGQHEFVSHSYEPFLPKRQENVDTNSALKLWMHTLGSKHTANRSNHSWAVMSGSWQYSARDTQASMW